MRNYVTATPGELRDRRHAALRIRPSTKLLRHVHIHVRTIGCTSAQIQPERPPAHRSAARPRLRLSRWVILQRHRSASYGGRKLFSRSITALCPRKRGASPLRSAVLYADCAQFRSRYPRHGPALNVNGYFMIQQSQCS